MIHFTPHLHSSTLWYQLGTSNKLSLKHLLLCSLSLHCAFKMNAVLSLQLHEVKLMGLKSIKAHITRWLESWAVSLPLLITGHDFDVHIMAHTLAYTLKTYMSTIFFLFNNVTHLAWADFKIKVKRIAHSTVHFDQWNPLISKM